MGDPVSRRRVGATSHQPPLGAGLGGLWLSRTPSHVDPQRLMAGILPHKCGFRLGSASRLVCHTQLRRTLPAARCQLESRLCRRSLADTLPHARYHDRMCVGESSRIPDLPTTAPLRTFLCLQHAINNACSGGRGTVVQENMYRPRRPPPRCRLDQPDHTRPPRARHRAGAAGGTFQRSSTTSAPLRTLSARSNRTTMHARVATELVCSRSSYRLRRHPSPMQAGPTGPHSPATRPTNTRVQRGEFQRSPHTHQHSCALSLPAALAQQCMLGWPRNWCVQDRNLGGAWGMDGGTSKRCGHPATSLAAGRGNTPVVRRSERERRRSEISAHG